MTPETPIEVKIPLSIPTADIAKAQSVQKRYQKCLPIILEALPLPILESLAQKIKDHPEVKDNIRNGTMPSTELLSAITGINQTIIATAIKMFQTADKAGSLFSSGTKAKNA